MPPGQSGFDVCTRIRELALAAFARCPARGANSDGRAGARAARTTTYEPFATQELVSRVRVLLGEAPLEPPHRLRGDDSTRELARLMKRRLTSGFRGSAGLPGGLPRGRVGCLILTSTCPAWVDRSRI
jgi:DNA-binding response OmpR family regulator